MFTADQQYLAMVGADSFYGFLARQGRELFRDEDFAGLYCLDNGRNSVAPSLLCLALLLQAHDRVSDAEATARAVFDLRWKVALGLDIEARPFAKSTLQLFRSQLVIHEQAQAIFRRSLEFARQTGYLRGRQMKAAVDTTVIFGRGAVEDTYNLIGHGIAKLCRVLALVAGREAVAWAAAHELERFFAPSLKGEAALDWDDAAAREVFLNGLIAAGQRCLEWARQARSGLAAGSDEDEQIRQAAELLTQLLWQDVEPTARGHQIKRGTAEDRVPSVEDPEQRHGHKSRAGSFTGYKGAIAVDPETQLVTAVDVVPGNAHDGEGAAALVAQAETNTDSEVQQVIGDTAYGSVATRQALGEREIIAPTVKPRTGHGLGKDQFAIDVPGERVRCPMGHETAQWQWVWTRPGKGKPRAQVKRFSFPAKLCRACPRYAECVVKQHGRGRIINWHQDEARLQAARALERTEYFHEQYRQRVVVEHRFARLVQLGIRQSRYFGRAKTRFQLLLAATVANLTLLAGALSPTAPLLLRALLAALTLTGAPTPLTSRPAAHRPPAGVCPVLSAQRPLR
jgi:transposase